ncbi:DUF2971 domain-containing protein [Sulfuricurvum sp.]|uniref:DUF2971 domain-containing protein n=1 Tax=Sulfuricurvum sp. TaxID=2025608 RepID=UPI002D505372|nr:DUF2971 domain-containing protein [Sulfuricurvum sp.]HZF71449.1 DUF2971 domain-containing protein [Sulfuricurvum sp.]
MKLYKFRALRTNKDFNRVKDIIENGFYCNDILGFNDMNEGVYTKNLNNQNISLLEKKEYKICSFSGVKALSSELMWGHYANSGRGIVIEIDVEHCHNIKEVKYDNDNNLNTIEEILTNKSEEWIYEDEYRYLSTDYLDGNKVKIGNICKVYFGSPYKHLSNYKEILSIHTDLKKYLRLKKKLEKFCVDQNIGYEDFKF